MKVKLFGFSRDREFNLEYDEAKKFRRKIKNSYGQRVVIFPDIVKSPITIEIPDVVYGTLKVAGVNYYGNLGIADNVSTSNLVLPTEVPNLLDIKQIELIKYQSSKAFMLKNNGDLFEAGKYILIRSPDPVSEFTFLESGYKKICGGYTSTHFIKDDDTLWFTGDNELFNAGDGTNTSHMTPIQIGTDTWLDASGGGYSDFTIAIKTDGTLWGAGESPSGELGVTLSSSEKYKTFTQIGSDSNWVQVSAGKDSSYFLNDLGEVFYAGWNIYDASDGLDKLPGTYTEVRGALSNCALLMGTNGKLYFFGQGVDDGTLFPDSITPIECPIPDGYTYDQIIKFDVQEDRLAILFDDHKLWLFSNDDVNNYQWINIFTTDPIKGFYIKYAMYAW